MCCTKLFIFFIGSAGSENTFYNSPNFSKTESRAVHYAASRGHIHILEVLLEHGADLNALDANKGNPVHSAAGGGRLATVVWLVEKKVQHDLKDKNSRTPEDMGQLYGYHHVAYWLLKQNASEDTREHTQVVF